MDATGSVAPGCIACPGGRYLQDDDWATAKAAANHDAPADCAACIAGKYVQASGTASIAGCIRCDIGKYSTVTPSSLSSDCTVRPNVVGRGHASLLTSLDAWHSIPFRDIGHLSTPSIQLHSSDPPMVP